MRFFPAFMDVKDKRAVVVGGGALALRKGRLLTKAGARLVFVAPSFDAELRAEFDAADFLERDFKAVDLKGAALVVSATDDEDIDTAVAAAARGARVPVNVVDRPHLSDFTVPSIVDRGDVVIGVSTAGAAPVLGRMIRSRIEAIAPVGLGRLAATARNLRSKVKDRLCAETDRRRFWEAFFRADVAENVCDGVAPNLDAAAEAFLDAYRAAAAAEGAVYIVGAGPGDPELLTLKALRVLQEADVILYDRLVGEAILDMARRDADRIYVGKAKSNHSMAQREIEALMIRLAREGQKVVRLKGGDPFVFGRGGEEADALKGAGVACYIVPGLTAATACGAAASVPLTHRDHSQAVTFVTGHAKAGREPDLDWASLAALGHTLVVYMGVGKAAAI
ncbi:MAG: siroheme synthase CysG, partial [Pseudomonadota bacterium]